MKYSWKYRDSRGSTVKHAFYNSRAHISLCRTIIPWYDNFGWQDDKKGLDRRRKCKRCLYVIKVNEGTVTREDHHGVARRSAPTPDAPAQQPSEPRSPSPAPSAGPGRQGPSQRDSS